MKDQYGAKVPNDLVVIPDITSSPFAPFPDEIQAIEQADWFQSRGSNKTILISASELPDGMEGAAIEDAGINLDEGIDTIDSVLKRYNETDGFYHA
jgi:hypothetical protein